MTRVKLAATIAAMLTLTACAEASSEINVPAPPIDPQMVRAAEQVLADAPPPPPGSCCIGVIVTEGTDPWAIGVMSPDGAMAYLTYDYGCTRRYDDGLYPRDVLPVLLDAGDLITWTTTDERLCVAEVAVVRKAAAVPEEG